MIIAASLWSALGLALFHGLEAGRRPHQPRWQTFAVLGGVAVCFCALVVVKLALADIVLIAPDDPTCFDGSCAPHLPSQL